MYRRASIRTLILLSTAAALCSSAAAQNIQWEALTEFQAGTCRNAIEDGAGNLLISLPVTSGHDFRGILRHSLSSGSIADVSMTTVPIRSYDTTSGGRLFCATEEGMLFSDNSGTDWFRDPQLGGTPIFLVRTVHGICHAVADSGFFLRYDEARQEWNRIGRIILDPDVDSRLWFGLAVPELVGDRSGRLFLSQSDYIPFKQLRLSRDGGVTWDVLSDTLWQHQDRWGIHGVYASSQRDGALVGYRSILLRVLENGMSIDTIPGVHGFVTDVVEDQAGAMFLSLGEWPADSLHIPGIMRSTDGGDSWTWLRKDIPVNHLACMRDGRLFCSSPSHGLLFMDPLTGDTSSVPVPYGNVTDIVSMSDGTVNVAIDSTEYLGFHSSDDHGRTWGIRRSELNLDGTSRPRFVLDRLDRLFLGGAEYRSYSWVSTSDGGQTFENHFWPYITAEAMISGDWIAAEIFYAKYSDDDAASWSSALTKLPYICTHWSHRSLDIEELHPGHVLASGTAGLAYRQGGNGSPWSPVGSWKPTDISVTRDGTVYVGTRDTTASFIRSTDHGLTWLSYGIQDSLAVYEALHAAGGVLVTTARRFEQYGEIKPTTGGGLRFSSDLVNWSDAGIGSGLPTSEVNCLARDSAGYIYAGTRGFGVYRSTVPVSTDGPTVLSAEAPHPARPTLELNVYPQPLASQGTIVCRMPAAGTLTLQLHDLLGRRIRTITDGRRFGAGIHHVHFDASRLPPGSYVLKGRDGAALRAVSILLRKL